jgi:hypothetical protein
MAPATLFGLVLVGAGLFVVAISRPLARSAAIIRTWFSSSVAVAWRTQREIPRVRLIAGFLDSPWGRIHHLRPHYRALEGTWKSPARIAHCRSRS